MVSTLHFICITALLILATTVSGRNIFSKAWHKIFGHTWDGVCDWAGCPQIIPVTDPGIYQGTCKPAPLSDIKPSDPAYKLLPVYEYDDYGFHQQLDTYHASPDQLFVYHAAVKYNGELYLRNQPMETLTQWKHLIYVLELSPVNIDKSHAPTTKLAYYLDGEGFCTIMLPRSYGEKYTYYNPWISATVVWVK